MSRPHDGQRAHFPFGNPFRMIFPKESYVSPALLAMLNAFEESLADKLKNLRTKDNGNVLSLSWMTLAMKTLCEIHVDIKVFIAELQFPVSEWDQKWMDVYLDDSVKLLDICIAFNSEISRRRQGQLLLQCVRHALDAPSSFPSSVQLTKSQASLDEWMQHLVTRNTRLENCPNILDGIASSLNSPKIKDSSKGKVLMRAMYGVKVVTLFICSVFGAAFSGSAKTLMSLQVSEKLLWEKAYNDLQFNVNGEIRSLFSQGNMIVLEELEAIQSSVKKLYPLITIGSDPTEVAELKAFVLDLGSKMERFSQGVDLLSNEVEDFFQIVLSGRDALLGSLRVDGFGSSPKRVDNSKEQTVESSHWN